jgi:hypothetical protein
VVGGEEGRSQELLWLWLFPIMAVAVLLMLVLLVLLGDFLLWSG